MGIYFPPKSKLGKFTLYLLPIALISLSTFYLLIFSGQRGGEGFFDNKILLLPFLLTITSMCVAFFTGIYSLLKKKDYSILVFITTVLGGLVLLFAILEVIFPH